MGGHVKLWSRIIAVAVFVIIALPVQWLAVRFELTWSHVLPRLFHRYAAWVIGLKVSQRGTMSASKHLLLVSNHVSWLDIIALGSVAPVSFIAKHEVGLWPVFGMLSRMQRTVFVDRARRSETGAVNKSVAARLELGDTMVLFAEGTTGDGTRLLPFRSALLGAARDAGGIETVVDLQPVAIAYTKRGGLPLASSVRASDIAWIGDIDLAPHFAAVLKGNPIDVEICFGEVIPFGPGTDRKSATREIEASVRAMMLRALRG
jgi:lyso-ornithine lipid O-acyltransferase